MTFIEAIKSVYSKYLTFSGRARRSEYWFFFLFVALLETLYTIIVLILIDETQLSFVKWSLFEQLVVFFVAFQYSLCFSMGQTHA